LESADLGLHSGNFDSYSFHLKKNRKIMPKRKEKYFSKIAPFTKVVQIQSIYSSQQSLILENTDLGLHSGKFDQYSFHLGIFC
jgi:hypothetical protein